MYCHRSCGEPLSIFPDYHSRSRSSFSFAICQQVLRDDENRAFILANASLYFSPCGKLPGRCWLGRVHHGYGLFCTLILGLYFKLLLISHLQAVRTGVICFHRSYSSLCHYSSRFLGFFLCKCCDVRTLRLLLPMPECGGEDKIMLSSSKHY
jgi:hypothetical protein